jgi:4-amino-4-deoxy-L-arabinose transferase-like glycosyltransferase
MQPRRRLLLLLLLVLLSLGINLVQWRRISPASENGETRHWLPLILNVSEGKGYRACYPEYFPFCKTADDRTAQREPVPVLLFAGVALVFPHSPYALASVEIFANAGIMAGVFLMAEETSGTLVALLAALLWSIYLPAIRLSSQISGDLIATLAGTYALLLFIRARRTGSYGHWIGSGIVFGLAALSRSAMIVLPVALGSLFLLGKRQWRPLVPFFLAFGFVLLPWIVRNYVVFHQLKPGSTLSGYNLYRENYPISGAHFLRLVNGVEGKQAVNELVKKRKDLTGRENEAQMDAVYKQEGMLLIRAHPVRYVALSAYRVLMMCFNVGVEEAYGISLSAKDYITAALQLFLIAFAVVGFVSNREAMWPFAVTALAILLIHLPVCGRLRYMIPAMPAVICMAAARIAGLWNSLRKRMILAVRS